MLDDIARQVVALVKQLADGGTKVMVWSDDAYFGLDYEDDIEKQSLFAEGYIAKLSSHCRGSAVDLTLLDMKTGKELDMGTPFDLFSEKSHPDYRGITDEQYGNRMILQRAMIRNGFEPLSCEWWHFRLMDEPYPNTYFEFPVSSEYLRR